MADEVIIGVSVSRATLNRADFILNTWYKRIPTVLMGHSKVPGYNIMITGVDADNYASTLGKGFYGLAKLFEDNPNLKWYALLDDDCFLYPDGLLMALSAFDPTQPWAFSQSDMGKVRQGGPQVWRMFGGAGIVLSNGMVKLMMPTLREYCKNLELKRRRQGKKGRPYEFLLDVALPRHIHSIHQEYHRLIGLYSQTAGFYLNHPNGKKDAPNGLPEIPITFHYLWGQYVYHMDYILNNVQLCAPPTKERNHHFGVGVLRAGPPEDKARARTWGNDVDTMSVQINGGPWGSDLLGHLANMFDDMPGKDWYVYLRRADVYVVEPNLRHLTVQMDANKPYLVGRVSRESEARDAKESADPAHGLILSRALVERLRKLVTRGVAHPPFNRRELAMFAAEQGTTVYHVDTLLVTTQKETQPELNLVHAGRIPNPHCAVTIPATPVIKELKDHVGSVTDAWVMG